MTDNNRGNYYIIADHLRTTIFALADGAVFEPKGRGYILKKLVKKVAWLAYFLNLARENLRAISEELITVNSSYYPYLQEKKAAIISSIEKELGKSQQLIIEAVRKLDNYFSPEITAQDIFFWYDTQVKGEEIKQLWKELEAVKTERDGLRDATTKFIRNNNGEILEQNENKKSINSENKLEIINADYEKQLAEANKLRRKVRTRN
ncbi:26081_t:CDS:2 [Racocetra persica]|uniref:26081_t:CDS:1 n=1 Tax=Racocetra persica TaxID=160502 RepID=A0ACA9Q0Q8_9GLOM|nr:26081_t:CDS:2 [Racocetra persica]